MTRRIPELLKQEYLKRGIKIRPHGADVHRTVSWV